MLAAILSSDKPYLTGSKSCPFACLHNQQILFLGAAASDSPAFSRAGTGAGTACCPVADRTTQSYAPTLCISFASSAG